MEAEVSISAGQNLSEVFAELVSVIIDGEHSARALELITQRSVELLQAASAGIVVADPRGGYRVVAASDERSDLAELFQTLEQEGPAPDVVTSGNVLTIDLTSADGRWPEFAPAARAMGIGWVHARPIRLGSAVVGALNLFRSHAGGDVPDQRLGEILCGMVSVVLTQERPNRRTERLAERIQQILNERGRVEQVKGILAAHLNISPYEAAAVLAHYARANGTTMVEVAGDLVHGRIAPGAITAPSRRGE